MSKSYLFLKSSCTVPEETVGNIALVLKKNHLSQDNMVSLFGSFSKLLKMVELILQSRKI